MDLHHCDYEYLNSIYPRHVMCYGYVFFASFSKCLLPVLLQISGIALKSFSMCSNKLLTYQFHFLLKKTPLRLPAALWGRPRAADPLLAGPSLQHRLDFRHRAPVLLDPMSVVGVSLRG